MNIEQALDEMQGSLTRLREGIRKLKIVETDKPDLSLNARVAKALGKWVVYDTEDGWGYIELGNEFHEIPDYPNDLVAIVEVAEAIAKKYEVDIWIRIKDGLFLVNIQKEHTVLCSAESECLPEAICLAIVKHAEGE